MSEREKIQKELVEFILNVKNSDGSMKFDASYGVTGGMKTLSRGKVRTITFGIARYFDGLIVIWKPNNITISGHGALALKYAGVFKSIEEVKRKLL